MEGAIIPRKQIISKRSKPKYIDYDTFSGRGDERETHILVIIHG